MTAAVAPASCLHCGLAVPAGRARFCCAGCEVVHGAIAANRLEQFYALRETAEPARTTDHDYTELDDPAFHRLHVEAMPGGKAHTALYLEDLRCTACVWLVETAPRCLAGVSEIRVDLGRSRADVVWDPRATSLAQIARHLDRIGHPPHPYRGLARDALRRREDRALLIKLGVAGAAAGNLMLLAIALYAGLFGGMSRADTGFFRWASMCVALPALGFAATPFFGTALGALRARRLHLDLPLSIGILAGLLWGAANVIRGVGEIYFDSLAMLVFLLLCARWIVLRHQRRASTAAELLFALTPSRAHRLDPARLAELATGAMAGPAIDVPIEAIAPGDVVRVLVGEVIPVDGEIVAGRSALDIGLLTGESQPVDVALGDAVHAGTVNVAAPLAVRATAVGEDTRVGKLVARIEALSVQAPVERSGAGGKAPRGVERSETGGGDPDGLAGGAGGKSPRGVERSETGGGDPDGLAGGAGGKSPRGVERSETGGGDPDGLAGGAGGKSPRGIIRLVDRVAGRFVAVVSSVAVLTLAGWSVAGLAGAHGASVAAGAEHAMALLIVTCPCALALATPLAVTVALGRAARRGVLVKGADALERLATPGTMFVDKTGTLTAGRLAVVTWRGDLGAAGLAAAVEAGSNHPVARALGAHAAPVAAAHDLHEELGRGVTATVRGHRVAVGAPSWVRQRCTSRPLIEGWIAELAERGETPIAIGCDGAMIAVAGLADPIRDDARAALDELARLGWDVQLLSGDDERVVRRVGGALGVPRSRCHGQVSPEHKVTAVVQAGRRGPVAMVGDGVNDAAAMAAASAGIAVSGAAEIAIEAADVYLRSPSITAIAATAGGARETLATIRRNLKLSLAYNLVAGALAVTGLIHPLIAAAVMPLSSLTVLASSLRSRAFRESSRAERPS